MEESDFDQVLFSFHGEKEFLQCNSANHSAFYGKLGTTTKGRMNINGKDY